MSFGLCRPRRWFFKTLQTTQHLTVFHFKHFLDYSCSTFLSLSSISPMIPYLSDSKGTQKRLAQGSGENSSGIKSRCTHFTSIYTDEWYPRNSHETVIIWVFYGLWYYQPFSRISICHEARASLSLCTQLPEMAFSRRIQRCGTRVDEQSEHLLYASLAIIHERDASMLGHCV